MSSGTVRSAWLWKRLVWSGGFLRLLGLACPPGLCFFGKKEFGPHESGRWSEIVSVGNSGFTDFVLGNSLCVLKKGQSTTLIPTFKFFLPMVPLPLSGC